jgi:hypothetical protein
MRSGTSPQSNLTRRANHRHIFIVPNPAGGSLPGFLLSVHPLDVLAAIRQLFAGVDQVSVLALLQKDGVAVDLFQDDGFRACRRWDRATLASPDGRTLCVRLTAAGCEHPDDEQEQANLRALEDRLTSTGNINDAWALYKARIASRR